MQGFLSQINWVDIVIVLILVRSATIAISQGFITELFKLLGLIVSVYIGMHYFTHISDVFKSAFKVHTGVVPLEFLDFLSFLVLVAVVYALFMALRSLVSSMFKAETVPAISRWGGLAVGIFRGTLLAALVTFMLAISSVPYLKECVVESYSGKRIERIAPATYFFLWDNFFSKFMTQERSNNTILEIQRGL